MEGDMDASLIEIRSYDGPGYMPLVDFSAWRVAVMRYSDPYHPEKIERVERHVETDEVFVLLAGACILLVGDGESGAERLLPQEMEPLKLYNVRRNVWHTILFSPQASVLIVENRDTGAHNTQFAPLAPRQRSLVRELGTRLLTV